MRWTLCACLCIVGIAGAVPRSITVKGDRFVDASGATVVLEGSNVVVKGAPWLPDVSGSARCGGHGCRTFNEADAKHFQSMGWNFLRLGVIWAGAQPTEEPKLDETYVAKLRAILDLCHAHGIHVLLDLHQDAVSSAVCGQGMPVWFYKKTQPFHLIGTPLVPQIKWPYKGTCGPTDISRWSEHSGSENYNIKNPCCQHFNRDAGWARLLPTAQAQAAIGYLFSSYGRATYAKFTGMLAAAVKDHPAAFGIELMNEPPALQRPSMYDTWMACYKAIRAEVPDMSVGLVDIGSIPLATGTLGLSNETAQWVKNDCHGCWYAFHYYSPPSKSVTEAINMAVAQQHALGGMPAILTETMDCGAIKYAKSHGIGAAHWHYSDYCDSGFGACITGFGDGNPNGCGHASLAFSNGSSAILV